MITVVTSVLDSRDLPMGANSSVMIIAFTCLMLAIPAIYRYYRRQRTTKLRGPPRNDFIFGVTKELFNASDLGSMYRNWEETYGPVYQIPTTLGSTVIVLQDPGAITHMYSKDTLIYHQSRLDKAIFGGLMGDVLFAMEGEDHKRQRKVLSSAFTPSNIRDLASVFFTSGNKVKAAWDSAFQGSQTDAITFNVQYWMDCVTLDSIGIGGFSHDFGSLKGNISPVMAAFDSFGTVKPSLSITLSFLFGVVFPELSLMLPSDRRTKLELITSSSKEAAIELLGKATTGNPDGNAGQVDNSILGVLVRSMNADSKARMSVEEVMSQIMAFFLAGYEPSAIILTWAFIELARNPEVQETLRAELRSALGEEEDSQLVNSLPYLDAFISEVLRRHPSAPELTREVNIDDTIPLTHPVHTASGELVDSIFVAKGTTIRIAVEGVNRSKILWGSDADKFDPKRWLDSNREGRRWTEIQGYKHLLTFGNGPRMCIGKNFAINEMKIVLSILVHHFSFELPDGPSTKLGSHRSINMRPKVASEEGPKVPLIVRRVER